MRESDASLTKAEKYRLARAAAGETQIQVWVDQALRNQLDNLVHAGKFKNRSQAVTEAVHRLIEGQRM